MADEFGLTKSVSAVPGGQEVQPLQQREGLSLTLASTPFSQELERIASHPTIIGDLASKMTVAASSKQADIVGDWLGENPQGDLLPGITNFDKRLEQAYSAKSAAVLSNQLQEMTNNGLDELNASFKLNPQAVAKFSQNMQETAKNIISLAPSSVRSQLENNYVSTLTAKNHELNAKIQAEQKADTRDMVNTANARASKDAFNNSVAGTQDEDWVIAMKQTLKEQREAGIITRKEEEAYYQEYKLNSESGKATREAIDAKANGKLESYLRDLPQKLSKRLPATESMAVLDNVMSYMGKIKSAESQDNQLILSELNRARVEGSLTTSMLIGAQSQLPEADYNNFITSLYSKKSSVTEKERRVTALADNFNNIEIMGRAKADDKDTAFDILTDKKLSKNPNQDRFQVQTGLAKVAGAEIPGYTKTVSNMLLKGPIDAAYQAHLAIESITDNPETAANLSSLNTQSKALNSVFKTQLQAGVPAADALALARKQVFEVKEDEIEFRKRQWKEIEKSHYSDPDQMQSKVRKIIGAKNHWFRANDKIPNLSAITNRVMAAFKQNYLATGDEDAAIDMLQKSLSQVYGYSTMNGQEEFVYLPIEKIAGIGLDNHEAIQYDIFDNLQPQLEATKSAYDKGNLDFYYTMDFEDGRALMNKHYRGSNPNSGDVETFNIQVTASPMLQRTNNRQQPVSGFYDVSLINDKGNIVDFVTASTGGVHTFGYRPNIARIKQMAAAKAIGVIPSFVQPSPLTKKKDNNPLNFDAIGKGMYGYNDSNPLNFEGR